MIDIERVKPGDLVLFHGDKAKVTKVGLERLPDMSVEIGSISLQILEGDDKHSRPCIFQSGFKYLEEYVEPKKLYNGKVACVHIDSALKYHIGLTVGRIYEFIEGVANCDSGGSITIKPIADVEELNRRFEGVRFIEVVENAQPELFTGKVICTSTKYANFTVGGIYKVVNGVISDDRGNTVSGPRRCRNVKDLIDKLNGCVQFIEVVE